MSIFTKENKLAIQLCEVDEINITVLAGMSFWVLSQLAHFVNWKQTVELQPMRFGLFRLP